MKLEELIGFGNSLGEIIKNDELIQVANSGSLEFYGPLVVFLSPRMLPTERDNILGLDLKSLFESPEQSNHDRGKIALASYEFARKYYLTSYDIPINEDGNTINPMAHIKQVFSLLNINKNLDALNNDRASNILEKLAHQFHKKEFLSGTRPAQRSVFEAFDTSLSLIENVYKQEVTSTEEKFAKSATKKADAINAAYGSVLTSLDKLAEYIGLSIKNVTKPTAEGFAKYAGIEIMKTSKNGNHVKLTWDYLNNLLTSNGKSPERALRELNESHGNVLAIQMGGNRANDTGVATLYFADGNGQPNAHNIHYSCRSADKKMGYLLLEAQKQAALGLSKLEVPLRNATTNAPIIINTHFGL